MIPIGSEASKGGCEIPAKKLNFAFEHEISLLFFPCQYLNFFLIARLQSPPLSMVTQPNPKQMLASKTCSSHAHVYRLT